jgi:hypothetical protein
MERQDDQPNRGPANSRVSRDRQTIHSLDHGGKAIALCGDSFDEILPVSRAAQRLSDRGDLHGHIGLFDEAPGPQGLHQQVFMDQVPGLLDQEKKRPKRLGRDRDARSGARQRVLDGIELIRTESIRGVGRPFHGLLILFWNSLKPA